MNTTNRRARRYVLPVLITGVVAGGAAFANAIIGPSTAERPYVVRTMKGVTTTALLTAGDSVNLKPDGVTPYRMVGIPDGLGAFDNEDGTFTVLMNHELGNTQGIVRAHGARGAFVSRWIIDKSTLEVLHGEDLMLDVGTFTAGAWDFSGNVAANRFCSADLPAFSAFYNASTGRGYPGRLFMNGEEAGSEGQGWAHAMDGTSYRLPWLGRFSWENCLAHPDTGDTTIVVGTDDDVAGQIYVYVGTKQTSGATPPDLAGLTNGTLYGIKVMGFPFEVATSGIPSGTSFGAFSLGNVFGTTGAALQTASRANGVTEFNRPEDGAWDPESPNDFYFVTTASFTTNSRLWRLRFVDPAQPWLGGTIDQLLTGNEGQHMFDNITINDRHQVFLQEDPGGQNHIARLWRYDVPSDTLVEIGHHDPDLFTAGEPDFLTIDEESSGIIDVSDILGEGKFLLDVQAHYATDGETVQGGQLLLMHVPPGKK